MIVEMMMAGMVVAAGPPQAAKPSLIPPHRQRVWPQSLVIGRDPVEVARCNGGAVTDAAWKRERGPEQPRPRRLGELPRASLERTVMRKVDGCVVPVIIRYEGEGVSPNKIGVSKVN
jgi:hypothetical protein